jgi:hypothetical protein
MEDLDKCLRCGKCCYHTKTNDKGEDYLSSERCKFLMILPGSKTFCRIYRTRLNNRIAPGYFCLLRKDTKYNYEGCTLNGEPENKNKKIITTGGIKEDGETRGDM